MNRISAIPEKFKPNFIIHKPISVGAAILDISKAICINFL